MKTVAFCMPTITRPYAACLDALEQSVPVLKEAGWESVSVFEVGNPYISNARNTMLRKALDVKPDAIVFLDHDLSWEPDALLKLVSTGDDMAAGLYRFKKDKEEYMGQVLSGNDGTPLVREDGCISAFCVPAGFLKVTPNAVNRFMTSYPELIYGDKYHPHIDLFNHGAHGGVWYGEDYALSRNWLALGGEIMVIPDVTLTHHTKDNSYPGNFHEFLLRQVGGSNYVE